MKRNMGTTDRLIRALVVAPVLVIVAWLIGFASIVGVILVVLAAVMVATAAVGFCPLYLPLHLSTDRDHPASV